MSGFAFHEAAVELSKVGVFESFAEPFEAFAAAGFYQGEDEQLVEESLVFVASFFLEFHQLIYVDVFALASEVESSFL